MVLPFLINQVSKKEQTLYMLGFYSFGLPKI